MTIPSYFSSNSSNSSNFRVGELSHSVSVEPQFIEANLENTAMPRNIITFRPAGFGSKVFVFDLCCG